MKQIRRDAWWNKSKLRDYQKIKDSEIENEGNDPMKETSQFNKSKKNSLKKRGGESISKTSRPDDERLWKNGGK